MPPPPPPQYQPSQPSGPAAGGAPQVHGRTLADWPTRAMGGLVDYVAPSIVGGILYVILAQASLVLGLIVSLLPIVYIIYISIQQGETGQTPGKRMAGTKLIREADGQPIGAGLSVGRYFLHFIDSAICYVGWLFPLWDAKRQTIADKIVSTVVVTGEPKQSFSLTPPQG
jgi:uncharacterized RDD family membrane protein YckC